MKFAKNLPLEIVSLTFLIAIMITTAISLPSWLFGDTDQASAVHIYQTNELGKLELDLPFKSFVRSPNDGQFVTGSFLIAPQQSGGDRYIFIPYYVGTIEFSAFGISIYTSDFPRDSRFITRVNGTSFQLLEFDPQTGSAPNDKIEISFKLYPDSSGLSVMSKIYIGAKQDFQAQTLAQSLYYDVFRNGMLGIQLFLFFAAAAFLKLPDHRGVVFSSLIILAYFISIGVSGVISQLRPEINISTLIFSSTPAVSAALLLYGFNVCRRVIPLNYHILIYIFIFTWVTLMLFAFLNKKDLQLINVYVSGPSILISLLLLLILCINSLRGTSRAEVKFLLSATFILFSSVLHDAAFRLGIHFNGVAMSPLGSMAFISVLIYSATQRYFSTHNGLAQANTTLTEALEQQSQRLSFEFERSAQLMRLAAVQEETNRMTRELHDGVLTYLGLINVISETAVAASSNEIGRLSRLATNEIRVILDARPSDDASLAIALSSLRQNIVEPLSLKDIDIEWSTVALLTYGPVEPKLLMNVVRIVQEAIHNAVVRAQCTKLSIIAERLDDFYIINIVNIGGSSFDESTKIGRGIANMVDRATQIGGSLSILSKDSGAHLLLKLPLPKER